MVRRRRSDGPSEMGLVLREYRSAFLTVGALSTVLNLLVLAGSLYMMLVYDSVLPSESVASLAGLFVMVTAAYIFQAVFDALRSRLLGDVAAAFDRRLAPRVLNAISDVRRRGLAPPGDGLGLLRDFDSVRGLLTSGGLTALIDLPWIVFFLGILFLLHYWLGVTALVGATILIGLTILANRQTRQAVEAAGQSTSMRYGLAEEAIRHGELFTALGMQRRMLERWEEVNERHRSIQERMVRTLGLYSGISKTFRMFLQSMILTVGALLVIDGQATGGVIFASSILSSRALAPVDQAIGNWRALVSARLGWQRLTQLLAIAASAGPTKTQLPAPTHDLVVEGLYVAPPGTKRPVVNGVSFRMEAGSALGIVGMSAAGKSSLARALVGAWPVAGGSIRLDGAALDQWDHDALGRHIGYLPQAVDLIDGTVAQNIARFDPEAASETIIAAAKAAGAHDLIVNLAEGYDTLVGSQGNALSAGQRQRIGLARALYGDPFLVVLDEPNSNLDAEGENALNKAIAGVRRRGGVAVLIAHRPAVLAQVDNVLVMRGGEVESVGRRYPSVEAANAA